jgi:hypothetical protein
MNENYLNLTFATKLQKGIQKSLINENHNNGYIFLNADFDDSHDRL